MRPGQEQDQRLGAVALEKIGMKVCKEMLLKFQSLGIMEDGSWTGLPVRGKKMGKVNNRECLIPGTTYHSQAASGFAMLMGNKLLHIFVKVFISAIIVFYQGKVSQSSRFGTGKLRGKLYLTMGSM